MSTKSVEIKNMNPEIQQVEENKWPELVRLQVDSLQRGIVRILVRDGRVVQVETTETMDLESDKQPDPVSTKPPEETDTNLKNAK